MCVADSILWPMMFVADMVVADIVVSPITREKEYKQKSEKFENSIYKCRWVAQQDTRFKTSDKLSK